MLELSKKSNRNIIYKQQLIIITLAENMNHIGSQTMNTDSKLPINPQYHSTMKKTMQETVKFSK